MISNFALQEYTGDSELPKSDLLTESLVLENGYVVVPDVPGLGIELDDAALAAIPCGTRCSPRPSATTDPCATSEPESR